MKLVMLRGIPGSGKSTLAAEMILKNPDFVRMNRDSLRTMLHCARPWSEEDERMTREVNIFATQHLLLSGRSVIIDDCNLNPKDEQQWKLTAEKIAAALNSEEMKLEFEVVDMDTPYYTCLERNRNRENPVPQDVVVQMAMRYQKDIPPEKGYVICDLDGTICDATHRLHFVTGEKKNFDAFYGQMHLDLPLEAGVAQLSRFSQDGYEIVYMTGRPEKWRGITRLWLAEHITKPFGITDRTILMRKNGDMREDTIVKKELLDTFFPRDKHLIRAVIEDRPRVARMFREEGLEVIEVGSGIEF